MKIKDHIPNFITLLNLFAGLLSIYYGMIDELQFAGIMIFVAAVFDFFRNQMRAFSRHASEQTHPFLSGV